MIEESTGTGPPPAGLLSPSELLALHRALFQARAAEAETTPPLPGRSWDRAGGVVGAAFALRRREDGSGDVLSQATATPGPLFAMGVTPLEFFRERLARGTSPSRGRLGEGSWTDFRRGLVGSVAVPGTGAEVMAGITLAFRFKGEDRVGMVVEDVTSTGSGAWHEGLNLAAVRRCPMVVLVLGGRPDGRAPARKHTRLASVLEICDGYGIPGVSVDGADVVDVHRAAKAATGRARAGEGVQLIELRAPEPRVPLDVLRAHLAAEGVAAPEELEAIETELAADVATALDRALSEASPVPSEALAGVWSDVALRAPWFRTQTGTPGDPHLVPGMPGGPFIDPFRPGADG